ncbi:MAG: tetratricopeptide repeat protein [Planctomycetota bacterium]|jgi:tetratricopeptide (TPR) repeat protein
MGKKNEDSQAGEESFARLETSEENRNKAKKWFVRARELGEKRRFDHAVEYYVNGLEYWPDAVEEGLKPLHGCAVARKNTGGKKPGLKDTMTRSMTDKDPVKALTNSLWLFGKDPDNISYIEGVTRNASRLRAEDAAKWAGGVFGKALEVAPKAGSKLFLQLVKLMEELGGRATKRAESSFGVEAYQAGIEALTIMRRRFPKDQDIPNLIKNMSTKLTIVKGNFEKSESFRESMADSDAQKELHDADRSVQSDERMEELIAKAEQAYKDEPDHPSHLRNLVDLLCRRDNEEDEIRAIGYLVQEFKRTDNYRWKQTADDIRIKQLGRKAREVAAADGPEAAKEHQINQLRFELKVFKERLERYPTDNRFKFDFAVRCFRAGRFDEAIPMFQAARVDPKNRIACGLYLGRSFFRKGYHTQAIGALQEAIDAHSVHDDALAKDLHYWLGRSQETAEKIEDARKTYDDLLQLDFNYRDVRERLEGLS